MTEAELVNLIAQCEGEGIECKANLLSRREIAEYAVGIGNAGGGYLVMGVSDRVPRKILPIQIPSQDEMARIRESVADSAQIHLAIEVVSTKEGAVIVATIPPRPRGILFHTRDGKYLIRLGEGLRGMTLAEIDSIRREGVIENTASPLPGKIADLISPVGMEELRRLMGEAGAASDLLRLPDNDLLRSLGTLTEEGSLLVAGLSIKALRTTGVSP